MRNQLTAKVIAPSFHSLVMLNHLFASIGFAAAVRACKQLNSLSLLLLPLPLLLASPTPSSPTNPRPLPPYSGLRRHRWSHPRQPSHVISLPTRQTRRVWSQETPSIGLQNLGRAEILPHRHWDFVLVLGIVLSYYLYSR